LELDQSHEEMDGVSSNSDDEQESKAHRSAEPTSNDFFDQDQDPMPDLIILWSARQYWASRALAMRYKGICHLCLSPPSTSQSPDHIFEAGFAFKKAQGIKPARSPLHGTRVVWLGPYHRRVVMFQYADLVRTYFFSPFFH
jgi:hypothetical protein